jgi:FdhD protein
MNKPSVVPVNVIRVEQSVRETKPDLVAVEEPLEIRLGWGQGTREQKSLSVTMRTPGHDFELALGFLLTECVIQSMDQVESIKYCEDVGKQEEKENVVRVELKPNVTIAWEKLQRNFYTSSSCGVCGKSSIEAVRNLCPPALTANWQVPASLITSLPDKLRSSQLVFEHTGGLHAVGVFSTQGELVLLREDVGRHNAFDKVVGALLLKGSLPAWEQIVVVSGRASFELVQKCAMAGFPIMASVGAPSSLAVSLAQEAGISLLGFVRGSSFNIYGGEQRITP